MPGTKRRRIAPRQRGITDRACQAWREGDCDALRAALSIKPWEILPWPLRLTALGCDPQCPPPPEDNRPWCASWPKAVALQAELYRLAGPPPRKLKRSD